MANEYHNVVSISDFAGYQRTAVIGSVRWSGLQVRVCERSVNPREEVICSADDTFPGELIDADIYHTAAIGSPLNFRKSPELTAT